MIIRTLVRKNGTWIFKKMLLTKNGVKFAISLQICNDLKDVIYI